MKIVKELKNIEFIYDDESKRFEIMRDHGISAYMDLNKVEAFALLRFIIRISQRNWFRSKNIVDKNDKTMLQSNPSEEEKEQLTMEW
jgi:hypothetical protein